MPWKLLEWYAINYFPNEIQQHKIAESIHQIQFISWSCVRDELPTQFGSFPFQSGGLSVSEAHGMSLWGVYDQGVSPQTQSSGGSNLIRLNSETLFFWWKKFLNWKMNLDLFFCRRNKHLGLFLANLFAIFQNKNLITNSKNVRPKEPISDLDFALELIFLYIR